MNRSIRLFPLCAWLLSCSGGGSPSAPQQTSPTTSAGASGSAALGGNAGAGAITTGSVSGAAGAGGSAPHGGSSGVGGIGGASAGSAGSNEGGVGGNAGAAPVICDTTAAKHQVSPDAPLVIPMGEIIGGTDVSNNAKNHPAGGYLSNLDDLGQFKYPATHGNQWGNTALVNDHVYWDTDGLQYTHAPAPDPGGGSALLWPMPGEWVSYAIEVKAPADYDVVTRFSSSWGPAAPVVVHFTIDDVSSGPVTLKPDDPQLWSDTHYQVGGWWGHTMISGTTPKHWTLAAGCHVVKLFIDTFPPHDSGDPISHGDVWVHYLKVAKAN